MYGGMYSRVRFLSSITCIDIIAGIAGMNLVSCGFSHPNRAHQPPRNDDAATSEDEGSRRHGGPKMGLGEGLNLAIKQKGVG